jgi:hypothetical protein
MDRPLTNRWQHQATGSTESLYASSWAQVEQTAYRQQRSVTPPEVSGAGSSGAKRFADDPWRDPGGIQRAPLNRSARKSPVGDLDIASAAALSKAVVAEINADAFTSACVEGPVARLKVGTRSLAELTHAGGFRGGVRRPVGTRSGRALQSRPVAGELPPCSECRSPELNVDRF